MPRINRQAIYFYSASRQLSIEFVPLLLEEVKAGDVSCSESTSTSRLHSKSLIWPRIAVWSLVKKFESRRFG